MLRFSPNKSQRTVEDPDLDARFVAVEQMVQQLVNLANIPKIAAPSTLPEQILQVLETGGGGGGSGSNVEPGENDWDLLRWDGSLWTPFVDLLRQLVIAPETDVVPLILEWLGTTEEMFVIRDPSGNVIVQVGSTGQLQLLGVVGLANNSALVDLYGFGTSSTTGIITRNARGVRGAETAIQANDNLGQWSANGRGSTGYNTNVGVFRFRARQNFTDANGGTYLQIELTPLGSVTAQEALSLTTDALEVPGQVLAGGGLGAPVQAASAMGSLVGAMEVFDETGASAGFIPVYDGFTP